LKLSRGMHRGAARSALSAVVDPLGELERVLGSPC